jgi:hypothetical protein
VVNLVFVDVLEHPALARYVEVLNEVIHNLRSPQGIVIFGRKCPAVVKTRWIYAVEVLHFVLQHMGDVNTARTVFEREAVPDNFKTFYRMLLPLRLFFGSMGMKGCKLYELMPIAQMRRNSLLT